MYGGIQDIQKRIQHLGRYQQMVSVMMKYGLGFLFSGQAGAPLNILGPKRKQEGGTGINLSQLGLSIRLALTELGPTYIKIGQLASTRPDIIPAPVIRELESLQDRVPPVPFEEIRYIIEAELKHPLKDIFTEFNPQPVAAASIGQVHYAVLRSGETVAVKVQRPYILQTVLTDLEILADLVGLIEKRTVWGNKYALTGMFQEFERILRKEMDYIMEGENADKLARALKKNPKLKIPKVYWEYTTKRVLTLEYLYGVPLSQLTGFEGSGSQRENLALSLSNALLEQILCHGIFHGDPHPGNILVLPQEKLAFLDFGIFGELTPKMRKQLANLVRAMLRQKSQHMVKATMGLGTAPRDLNPALLERELEEVRKKHLEVPIRDVSFPKLLTDFLNVASRHRIQVPADFALVARSLMILEGIVHELAPGLSIADLAKPLKRKLFWARLGEWLNNWA